MRRFLRVQIVFFAMLLVAASFFLSAMNHAHAAGNVLEYTYDAAGRIVAVKRQASPGLAIAGFSPATGVVGSTVTISGNAFDPMAANNIVKFNGLAATVVTASTTGLVVTVPTGATTGKISVTVAGATVTSLQDFVVSIPGAPTISGFTPLSGVAGASVTVSGTNFAVAAGATTARLNNTALSPANVTVSQFSFVVPAATGSGPIKVTTADGTAISASDFIVPPGSLTINDIATTKRLAVGQPAQSFTIAAPGKSALLFFEGTQNAYYSLQLDQLATSPLNASIGYTVYKPDNSYFTGASVSSYSPTILLPRLPIAGTYTIVLSPGPATIDTDLRLEEAPLLSMNAPAYNIATVAAGQQIRMRLAVTAGQHVGIGATDLQYTPTTANRAGLQMYKPDGVALPEAWGSCVSQCDVNLLSPPVSGEYTLVASAPTGSKATFSIWVSPELVGILTPDMPQAAVISRPGQNARFSFAGVAGDSFAVELSALSNLPASQSTTISVKKLDGTYFASGNASQAARGGLMVMPTLPATGNYEVFLDPITGATSSFNITLKKGVALVANGAAVAFATSVLGESTRLTFSGTAGQFLAIAIDGLTYTPVSSASTYLTVYKPDGTFLNQAYCATASPAGSCKLSLAALPVTGNYSVIITPPTTSTNQGNARLSAPVTGTLVSGAASVALDLSRPGANARFSFAGTLGDSLGVELANINTTPAGNSVNISVLKPDGVYFVGSSGTRGAYANIGTLPATGTYTIVVESTYGLPTTGQLRIDPGTTLIADGSTVSFATTQPGAVARFTFAGTAGQQRDFAISGMTHTPSTTSSTYVYVYRPDGINTTYFGCNAAYPGGNCNLSLGALTVTGKYSLLVFPQVSPSAVLASGTATLSSPVLGTLAVGASAVPISTTRVGQTVRLSFSGTAGQLLRISWSGISLVPSMSLSGLVLKPDGTNFYGFSIANGSSSFADLTALPVTGTYTLVLSTAYGATTTGLFSLSAR